MNDEKVKAYGSVDYVEPTDFFDKEIDYRDPIHGNTSDAISYPYEDYGIAVDLEVRVGNRYSCGLVSENGDSDLAQKTYNYSSRNGTLSFFGGKSLNESKEGSNFLTTSFTDISNTNPTQDGECFGIESIDIKYNSWLYPEVEIKFVDVRGAAIMAPSEYSYFNKGEYKGNMIYKSFFLYPYPVYILKVKGLYGRGTTYKLALKDVNIEFDSDNGNFIFNASFIGYMFGIYADMPLSFVAIAPYLSDGANYWKKQCDSKKFYFRDENGFKTSPMIRLPELRQRISEISTAMAPEFSSEDGTYMATDENDIKKNDNQLIKLDELIKNEIFSSWFTDDKGFCDFFIKTDTQNANDFFITTDYSVKKRLTDIISEFTKNIMEYDKTFGTSYYNSYINESAVKIVGGVEHMVESFRYDYDANKKTYDFTATEVDGKLEQTGVNSMGVTIETRKVNTDEIIVKLKPKNPCYDDVLNTAIEYYTGANTETPQSTFYIVSCKKKNGKSIYDLGKQLFTDFKKIEKIIDARAKNIADEIENKKLQKIKEILGFNPSVQNIYNLLFAHFETFIYCFYRRMDAIQKTLGDKSMGRFKKELGIVNGETDTPDADGNDEIFYYNYLPPYPGFFKDKSESNNSENVGVGKEYVWPSNIHGKNLTNSLHDVYFIKEILDAASFADSDLDMSDETGNWNEDRWVNPKYYIPSTVFDYIVMSLGYGSINPYLNLGFRNNNLNVYTNMISMFALRLFKWASEHTDLDNSKFKSFGKREAINVINAIGDDINDSFTAFINGINDDKKRRFIENITSGDSAFFKTSGKNLTYTFSDRFYPLLFNDVLDLKDVEDGLLENREFLKINGTLSKDSFVYITESEYETIKNKVNTEVIEKIEIPEDLEKGKKTDKRIEEYKKELADGSPKPNFKGIKTSISNENLYTIKEINKRIEFLDGVEESTIYQKAFMFLMESSTGNLRRCSSISNNGSEEKNWVCANKLTMLREGAYHFMLDNTEIENGAMLYNTEFSKNFNVSKYEYIAYNEDGVCLRRESRRVGLKNIFKNWATSSSDFKGLLLLLKDDTKRNQDEVTKFVKELHETKVWLLDEYIGVFSRTENISLDSSRFVTAFGEFLDTIKTIYKKAIKKEKVVKDKVLENKIAKGVSASNDEDLCLSAYLTMKNLYDKWLSFCDNNEEKWSLVDEDNPGAEDSKSEFSHFLFVDNFYNDIGYKLNVNLSKISAWLSRFLPSSNNQIDDAPNGQNKTFYEFLTDIAQDSGAMLLSLPQNISVKDKTVIRDMFRPVPASVDWLDNTPTFVFMYTYKPSSIAGNGDENANTSFDLNGFNPNGDGFNITDEIISSNLFKGERKVPAFGVTFGKQNQAFFKKIGLNTNTNTTTEASISGTFNVASRAGEGVRESTLYGQDLYKVRGAYSYTCSVETTGNMQIMPTMYFQLNNIPLWKGAYQIMKVTHNITAGNITTNFEGVKINKYAIPFAKPLLLNIDSEITIDDNETLFGASAISSGFVPFEGTGNYNDLPEYRHDDFRTAMIDEQHPLICLTPAHGPRTKKWLEWQWSTTIVNRVADKLRHSIDNPWLKYNVHICNENGRNTTKNGYNMSETRSIVKYFGDNKVISVVPHWNAGEATYLAAIWYSKTNTYVKTPNPNSYKLAECFIEASKNVNKPKTTMPDGAMDGYRKVKELTELNEKATDGAIDLSCPCALIETWFGDYGCRKNNFNWDNVLSACSNDKPGFIRNYKDKIMAAWLMSEEGLDYVSDMYANAINMYIQKYCKV